MWTGIQNENLPENRKYSLNKLHETPLFGKKRSVKHLMRLVARNPDLRQKQEVAGYLDSLIKAGIIDKNGHA